MQTFRNKLSRLFFISLIICAALLTACGSTAEKADEAAAQTPELTATPEPEPTATPVPYPCILLEGGDAVKAVCGRPFADPGFTAFNAEGEDMTESVTVEGEVLCWKVGEYELTYTLMQDEELIAEAKRTVRIVPNELPDTKPAEEKVIYLTFDDGPCKDTPELLDILAKYNAKATFFIVGNHNEEELAVLPRIAAEGHAIGVHAYRHEYGHLYHHEREFFEDFMQAQEIIYNYTGQYATLSRFPGSSRYASWLKEEIDGGYEEIAKRMHDMGVRFYDWNVQIEDRATGVAGTLTNFKYGIPSAKLPLVVLQHDVRYFSIAAMDEMLQWGIENGYEFRALDTTVPEIHFFQDR